MIYYGKETLRFTYAAADKVGECPLWGQREANASLGGWLADERMGKEGEETFRKIFLSPLTLSLLRGYKGQQQATETTLKTERRKIKWKRNS